MADAKSQLNSLNVHHRNRARHAQEAAENRYSKLKELTESLCDQCWEIFPALDGKKFNRPLYHGTNGSCINCGSSVNQVISEEFGSVQNPPKRTDYFDQAQRACKDARSAISGEPQLSGQRVNSYTDILLGYSFHNVEPVGRLDPRSRHYKRHSSAVSPFHNMKESKRELLGIAEIQKNEAEKQVETVMGCIHNWTAYINHHERKLQEINSALADVEKKEQSVSEAERERAVLEQRLRQLNGGRSSSSHLTPDNTCPICWNRAKEIVFQCGHQCCSACSGQIHTCHLCRVRIVQRIKLH